MINRKGDKRPVTRADSFIIRGLRESLDSRKGDHNDYGYADFIKMMTVRRRPTYSSIGRLFNVDGQTVKKWWEVYLLEQEKEGH
jgi:hypothetical protein